jgi:lipopolysaccharide assembly LptE-like protein
VTRSALILRALPAGPWPLLSWVLLRGLLVLGLLTSTGCNRYLVGNQTLYPPDIQTVYVPVFDSTSFRRGLGERLTEAVVKEIELKTPYKVVNSPDADSVLSGRIINDTKGALAFAPVAEPRYLLYNMRVEVAWVDRKGLSIAKGQPIPLPQSFTIVDQNSYFAPEIGQSVATAQQQDIQRLAEQIVSLMEAPW